MLNLREIYKWVVWIGIAGWLWITAVLVAVITIVVLAVTEFYPVDTVSGATLHQSEERSEVPGSGMTVTGHISAAGMETMHGERYTLQPLAFGPTVQGQFTLPTWESWDAPVESGQLVGEDELPLQPYTLTGSQPCPPVMPQSVMFVMNLTLDRSNRFMGALVSGVTPGILYSYSPVDDAGEVTTNVPHEGDSPQILWIGRRSGGSRWTHVGKVALDRVPDSFCGYDAELHWVTTPDGSTKLPLKARVEVRMLSMNDHDVE